MESYEQKYKEALGWMQGMYGGLHGKTKEEAEKYFPELKESEDEKVKRIIHSISNKISFHLHDIFTEEEFQCFDAWSNAWLENQGQVKESPILQQENKTCCKNGNSLTCKNDTILDLLQKMPSCITVDGIDYHFVMKKTITFMAFYEGEGEEGRDKIIFWMAGDPIYLLTAMLEKLKKEGLLDE